MGLLINEIIKVIKRPFIWIFFCAIFLSYMLCAYYISGSGTGRKDDSYNFDGYLDIIRNIENRIGTAESEEERKSLQDQKEFYELVYEYRISEESWRFDFLEEIYEAKAVLSDNVDLLGSYTEIALNNDWMGYYSARIRILESLDATEETKLDIEMYKTLREKKAEPVNGNRMYMLIKEYYDLKKEDTENEKELAERLAVLERMIGKNNLPEERNSARGFLSFTFNLKYLFVYFIALGISVFSCEYIEGTAFQFLTYPFLRCKKLLSKYATVLILLLTVLSLSLIFAFVFARIFFDPSDLAYDHVYYSRGSVKEMNYSVRTVLEYLAFGLKALSCTALGAMLTVILKKPALPVAVSCILYLFPDTDIYIFIAVLVISVAFSFIMFEKD